MDEDLKFEFKEMIIQDKEGNQIDLSKIKTLEDLKNAIIYEIEFPYCKNCGFYSMCPYKKDTSEGTCALLDPAIRRYIDMNIKSIDYTNSYYLEEFIKSCYYFAHMSKDFLDLIGIYTDDHLNYFFEGTHASMNSLFSHKILINLSKYLDSTRKTGLDRIKKFIILVEGKSDKIILKSILKSLRVLGIDFDIKNSIRFYVLEGKGRITKRDSIKDYFKRFKENGTEHFLFMDKDSEGNIQDLIREGLVEGNHVFYFENELEEEYNLDGLIKNIEKLDDSFKGVFTKNEILKKLKEDKNLKDSLTEIAKNKRKSFDLDNFKTRLAELFAKQISEELEKSTIINRVHRGDINPKSKNHEQLVERIRPFANMINKISQDFYVISKEMKDKKDEEQK